MNGEITMKKVFGIVAVVCVIAAQAFTQTANAAGLPRTPSLVQPQAVAPYNPPSIANPSAGVMQSDQSFQLNRGLGNNPINRDAYVRFLLVNFPGCHEQLAKISRQIKILRIGKNAD